MSSTWRTLFTRHRSVAEELAEDDEKHTFLEQQTRPIARNSTRWGPMIPWIVALSFAFSTAWVSIRGATSPTIVYFPSDLTDAHRAVKYEPRMYTGALEFDEAEGKIVRVMDGHERYFGPPNEAIDTAWATLLQGRAMTMTEEEATPFRPELTTALNTDKYIFEFDMFHQLHCINALRAALSPLLYPDSPPASSSHNHWDENLVPRADHLEHCMDRLRQGVMCHGDLTPSLFYSADGFNGIAVGKAGNHTCRRFDAIRSWMDERHRRYPLTGKTGKSM